MPRPPRLRPVLASPPLLAAFLIALSAALVGAGCRDRPERGQAAGGEVASAAAVSPSAVASLDSAGPGPSPPGSSAAASAAPGSSAAPVGIDLHLTVEERPRAPTNFVVYLDSPALGLHVLLGELGARDTCRLRPVPAGYVVGCTPAPRIARATITREKEQLTVRVPEKKLPVSVALAAEAAIQLDSRDVHSRQLAGHGCKPEAKAHQVVASLSVNENSRDGASENVVFILSGDSQPVALVELPLHSGCKAGGDEAVARWACPPHLSTCTVKIEDDAAVFACDGASPIEGRRLLSCGALGKISPKVTISTTYN